MQTWAYDGALLPDAPLLRPCPFQDLNPEQAVRDNTVLALTERIALQNEPYYHQYLALDMESAMKEAGFTNVQGSWVNKEKNKTAIDCSLRILIATKM